MMINYVIFVGLLIFEFLFLFVGRAVNDINLWYTAISVAIICNPIVLASIIVGYIDE